MRKHKPVRNLSAPKRTPERRTETLMRPLSQLAVAESGILRKSWYERVRFSWPILVFELLGFLGIFVAIAAFWIDYLDRREERVARHWQLIATRTGGEAGKSAALEFLVAEGISLYGIDLSAENMGEPVVISSVDLTGADFRGADLRGVTFENTILRNANFSWADLRDVRFGGSDLEGAEFYIANLSNVLVSSSIGWFSGSAIGGRRPQGATTLYEVDFTQATLVNTAFYDYCFKNGTRFDGAIVDGASFSADSDDRACLPILDNAVILTSEKPTGAVYAPADLDWESDEWEAYMSVGRPTMCRLSEWDYPGPHTAAEIKAILSSTEFAGEMVCLVNRPPHVDYSY